MRNMDEVWASLKNLIQEHGKQEYAYFLWFSMHIYLKIWILKWKNTDLLFEYWCCCLRDD